MISHVQMARRVTRTSSHTDVLQVVCGHYIWALKVWLWAQEGHVYLKHRAVCGKRIALLNNSQVLMNVAGDMWGETNSNRHIMKSAQCLVSKETLN